MTGAGNVLWIGGRSGAGKSTVARLLARRHGLRWYSCDTRTWEHRDRAIEAGNPAAIAWERLTPAERSALSPADALRLTIDRSAMVLDDIAALPDRPAVVAEGTNITPAMVPRQSAAIWLMAEPALRAERTRQRGWGAGGGELEMIKERELRAEISRVAALTIDTDQTDPGETAEQIETVTGGWFAEQPTAQNRAERQLLIREGNAAIVNQYRAGMARAGNLTGGSLVRTYDCECGDTDCTALIERTLASIPEPFLANSSPILASGHHG